MPWRQDPLLVTIVKGSPDESSKVGRLLQFFWTVLKRAYTALGLNMIINCALDSLMTCLTYQQHPVRNQILKSAPNMATKWCVTVANSVKAIKHTGWK